jgi:hypothetical protein
VELAESIWFNPLASDQTCPDSYNRKVSRLACSDSPALWQAQPHSAETEHRWARWAEGRTTSVFPDEEDISTRLVFSRRPRLFQCDGAVISKTNPVESSAVTVA